MNLGLSGKCALVTGASKGLGKAIAEELAREGANVSICARGAVELEQTAQALRAYGVKVAAIQADVAKTEEVQRVIDETIAALGRIDILINNAGTAWLDHTLTTTDEQWQYCMEINCLVPCASLAALRHICGSREAGALSIFQPPAHIRLLKCFLTMTARKQRCSRSPKRCHSSLHRIAFWLIVSAPR